MFLQLEHQKLEIFKATQNFVYECYRLTKFFPAEEKFAMVQQIRRAALSAHLNVAEGCSRKSEAERKRFFEISRGSLIEVDAALDIAAGLQYCQQANIPELGRYMLNCFKMLSTMIRSNTSG